MNAYQTYALTVEWLVILAYLAKFRDCHLSTKQVEGDWHSDHGWKSSHQEGQGKQKWRFHPPPALPYRLMYRPFQEALPDQIQERIKEAPRVPSNGNEVTGNAIVEAPATDLMHLPVLEKSFTLEIPKVSCSSKSVPSSSAPFFLSKHKNLNLSLSPDEIPQLFKEYLQTIGKSKVDVQGLFKTFPFLCNYLCLQTLNVFACSQLDKEDGDKTFTRGKTGWANKSLEAKVAGMAQEPPSSPAHLLVARSWIESWWTDHSYWLQIWRPPAHWIFPFRI